MKVCKKCKSLKEEFEFYKSKTCKDKLSVICKSCHLEKYYIPTPNKKICKECNISLNINNGRNSGHKRKDGSMIYANTCKNCHKKYNRKYMKQRRKNNTSVRLYESIKSVLNRKIKTPGYNEKDKYLCCTIKDYKIYLEQQFGKNMSWENYGSYWEIDHIIPLSKGGSFHYTNTQPLTVTENRVKSNKI
tara:strand:- start:43 stop:609 length:567 start_codon:yes stop_codon:yes gene_type:complete